MAEERWGTFSPTDHKRHNALVIEVLLYDRLVIPVPPAGDSDERQRWVKAGRRPNRLDTYLDLLGVVPNRGRADDKLAIPVA